MNSKRWYLLVSLVALSLAMSLVDGVLQPSYWVKSALKAVLFLGVPLSYFWKFPEERGLLKGLFAFRKKPMVLGAVLGLLCFGGIVGAYWLLQDVLDFSGITKSLTGNAGIGPDNFLAIAVYISFVNSLLEEFFFRGFGFLTLKSQWGRWPALLLSSFCFSFYHVGMTLGWVAPGLFVLELLGLMVGGLLFNLLDEKEGSIYPSWLMHMGCNFGINTIGLMLFGMI